MLYLVPKIHADDYDKFVLELETSSIDNHSTIMEKYKHIECLPFELLYVHLSTENYYLYEDGKPLGI